MLPGGADGRAGRVVGLALVLASLGSVIGPAGAAADEFVPGQVIARFAPGVGAGQAGNIAARTGGEDVEFLAAPNLRRIELEPGVGVGEAIADVEDDPNVRYAEPDEIVRSLATFPDDTHFDLMWGLHNTGQGVNGGTATPDADIDAPEAWDLTTGDSDIRVGVLDTGIQLTHPDLEPNICTNPGEVVANGVDDDGNGFVDDVHGWDFIQNDNAPVPGSGEAHGSHVAGTIGARGNNGQGVPGVSWQIGLLPLRFLGSSGNGSTSDAIEAINYAADNGVDIINGSYGGGGFLQAMFDAVAARSDVLFVFAAGNSAHNNDAAPEYPCSYPLANIICVAATRQTDALASFSSYGATSVDLAAPGTSTLSTVPAATYGFQQGTSMATPHVAGVAALLLARNPTLTVPELRSAILSTVDPQPSLAGKVVTGGRLNAFQAFQSVPDTNPPETSITKAPGKRTKARKAVFAFTSSEAGSTFRCKLDKSPQKPCRSPFEKRVKPGRHTFLVRATDLAGNTSPTPAKWDWKVIRRRR